MKTAIDRLLEIPSESLSVVEAAYVLGLSPATVLRMASSNQIGSSRFMVRGAGMKKRTMVPRGSVIRQLVRLNHADARENLLIEIAAKCPDLMPLAQLEADKATGAEPVKSLPGKKPAARGSVRVQSYRSDDSRQLHLF